MCVKWNKKKYSITGWAKTSNCKTLILLISLLFYLNTAHSQSKITTVGIQYKPIFSFGLTGGGTQTESTETLSVDLNLTKGSSFGLIVRQGLSESISLETGINLITRHFKLDMDDLDSTFSTSLNYKMINYEIPIQGLIYIRMSDKLWMNTSLGMSMNIYPTNVKSKSRYFTQFTRKHKQFQMAVVANIGFEYRSKKSGFFYIGASLYNPFNDIAHTSIEYEPVPLQPELLLIDVSGNFLTIDFRYFFHENPTK